MSILIVSANSLFKEVIIASVGKLQSDFIELKPDEALNRICELKPEVIIMDKTIIQSTFEGILTEARNLEKTRTIVLDPNQNEIILLDSRQKKLKKMDDLIEAIGDNL